LAIVGGCRTVVVAIALLLPGVGSVVVLAAVAVLVIVAPVATPLSTLTTTWKVAVSPLATEAFEKMTLPVRPTAGIEETDQPGLPVIAETKVVLVGVGSVTVTVLAPLGPLLMKLIV
jgi:hypothetical protein